MAHFALMVWGPTDYGDFSTYQSEQESAAQMRATGEFNARLQAAGVLVYVNGFQAPALSKVVVASGEAGGVSDGPHSAAHEYINGLWVVDVPTMDDAVALAQEGSQACGRTIEVRAAGA